MAAHTSPCRHATSCRNRSSGHIHRCGSRARVATRSIWLRRKASARSSFAFFDPEEAQHWVTDYYETLASDCVPIGDAVNANIACVTTFMCHDDEQEAIRRGVEGTNFLGYSLADYYVFGRHRPGVTDVWAEYEQRRAEAGYSPEAVKAAAENRDRLGAKAVEEGTTGLRGAVGTPDQVRDYLRRYEEYGVDQVILATQAGKNRHEDVMESLELFGRTVLPEFMERDEQASREKERRMRADPRRRARAQTRLRPPAAAGGGLRVSRDPALGRRPAGCRQLPRVARRVRAEHGRGRGRESPAREAALRRHVTMRGDAAIIEVGLNESVMRVQHAECSVHGRRVRGRREPLCRRGRGGSSLARTRSGDGHTATRRHRALRRGPRRDAAPGRARVSDVSRRRAHAR